jgi:hypothetical protein
MAACEALIAGEAFGLDRAVMVCVLNLSSDRNNSTVTKIKPQVLPGVFRSDFALAFDGQRQSNSGGYGGEPRAASRRDPGVRRVVGGGSAGTWARRRSHRGLPASRNAHDAGQQGVRVSRTAIQADAEPGSAGYSTCASGSSPLEAMSTGPKNFPR